MASSSRSFKYDVFLSFRGGDTRLNFVDHLSHALQQKGIDTYIDNERINQGKRIQDELMESIEDSKFYIIVFSKNYADSRWCLKELVKIMECHKTTEHTAFPLFYDVEPSEVRNQSGAVGNAFTKYENEENAGKWREALKEAADLAGWELKNTADRHEAKFIQIIVEKLSLELRAINFSTDEKLVGMETRVDNVLSSLENNSDDVRMIGIKGMGGGGKTTLARAIFDHNSFQFQGASFVENVRDVSKASQSGLKSLQNQIISDVFNEPGISISTVQGGINMMKRRMCCKKVLIVLDDVDHIEQLEALAGQLDWFKPGSLIIITTREEQVLVAHGVKSIHNVELLLDEESLCLFSRCAFGRVIPNQGYEELSRQVVHYAAGLPLTIRVLGSSLCGKTELEWKDALESLKTTALMGTLKKLEISYTSLEDDCKEIFLNVACIMKGWPKALVVKVLESCNLHARNNLRELELKSLITVDRDGNLGMHDRIEEMGKNIVRRAHPHNPSKHSLLWIDEEIENIFANDLGTKATRYMKFKTWNLSSEIVMKGLRKMKELRFLDVFVRFSDASESDCSPRNRNLNCFPNSLRYLCWNRYPFRSLPEAFQANNLVALEMSDSRIEQLWEDGERKVLNKLRFLDLSSSMLRTLDLGLTANIEMLNLSECGDLIELRLSHRCLNLRSLKLNGSKLQNLDLGLTPNLETLDLQYCYDLEELHMVGIYQKLTFLNISHSKLRNLDLRMAPNLETLDLQECYNLVELHIADECLKTLVCLDLSGCLGVRSSIVHRESDASCSEDESGELYLFVESLDGCKFHPENNLPKYRFKSIYRKDVPLLTRNLHKLISAGSCACTNLATFVGNIYGLQRIKKLKLQGNIREVSEDLVQLECLELLDLSCAKINHLPDSICMLKHLEFLDLKNCSLLEKLPEDLGRLECLKKLILSSKNIRDLPDSICMLKHLESLKLLKCSMLEKLPEDLGRLACLRYLSLTLAKIKDLPDSICMLKHLESLQLYECHLLEKLPEDLGQLTCLRNLSLSSEMIEDLPDSICMLKHLKSLLLNKCPLLEKLPKDLGRLECLEELNIIGTRISYLPQSIFLLKGLRILGSRYGICYYVQGGEVSNDDVERLERPGKKAKKLNFQPK